MYKRDLISNDLHSFIINFSHGRKKYKFMFKILEDYSLLSTNTKK